jgi:hypothetical protein
MPWACRQGLQSTQGTREFALTGDRSGAAGAFPSDGAPRRTDSTPPRTIGGQIRCHIGSGVPRGRQDTLISSAPGWGGLTKFRIDAVSMLR